MKYIVFVLGVLLSFVVSCSRENSGKSASKPPGFEISVKTTLLATIANDEKPQSAAPSSGVGMHAPLEAQFQPQFSRFGTGVAYSAEKNNMVYVVHNGKRGKEYTNIGAIALSPDGSRIAYGALVSGKWCMVIDGNEGTLFNTVKAPLFSPDGKHVAYQAMAGEKWHLVVDDKPNAGTTTRILDYTFNGDSSKIAYIDDADDKNYGRLIVSDLTFSKQAIVAAKVSRLIVNKEMVLIAAIGSKDSKQYVVESSFNRLDTVKSGPQHDKITQLTFNSDDTSVLYVVGKAGSQYVVYNGKETAVPDGGSLMEVPAIRNEHNGVGMLVSANDSSFMYQFPESKEDTVKKYDVTENLLYSQDGTAYAYAALKGKSWFVVANGVEGPAFDRVVSPLFSPDGNRIVYRARKDGKRFVVVADRIGRTIKELPSYGQVFEVQFSRDGKFIGYGVKDGQKLIWKVERL